VKLLFLIASISLLSGCAQYRARQDAKWNADYSWVDWPTNVPPSEQLPALAAMAQKRDGTNCIGVYLGMIAEHDGKGAVMMYSATSGELLKWITYSDFRDIFVLKTKPEYPKP
jgi:hypothetical protein